MSNTIDANLIASKLAAKAISQLSDALAPLAVFSTDFSDDVVAPQGVINVPVAVSGSNTLVDPANFEQGDGNIVNAKVVMNHYSQPFHLTSKELNSGSKLDTLAEINLDTFALKIQDVAFAKITTSAYGDAVTSGDALIAPATRSEALKTAWGELKGKRKNFVGNSEVFAGFIPTDTLGLNGTARYGFKNFVYTDDMSALPSKSVAFVCAPQAMAVATAVPENPAAADMLAVETAFIEDLGITVQVNVWSSKGSRAIWASYDIAFGAVKAVKEALKIVKTA